MSQESTASGICTGMHRLSEDDREFASAFFGCRIPAGEFGHREHLRMAYICLAETDPEIAFQTLRNGLLAFLEHHGAGPDKYHETLTRAWLIVVRQCMEKTPDAESAEAFLGRHPELADRDLLRVHYSRERLFSDEARRSFTPPDRAPFPGAGNRR